MRDSSSNFALEGIDKVLHEKVRLAILLALMRHGKGLKFSELLELCKLTPGNLGRHLQVLQEVGFIEALCERPKRWAVGRPPSSYRMTRLGRERFLDYLEELERVVQRSLSAARAKQRALPTPSPAEG